MLWLAPALLFSVLRTGYISFNEFARIPGNVMIFWRGFMPFLLLTPVMFLIDKPESGWFYLFVFCNALFASVADSIMFESSLRYGGGLTLRLMPLSVLFIFIFWLILSADERAAMLMHPVLATGIVCFLVLGMFAISRMRHCTVTRSAFLLMLPAIFLGAFVDIFNKTAMNHAATWQGVLTYVWFQSMLICLFSVLYLRIRRPHALVQISAPSATLAMRGFLLGLVLLSTNTAKNTAMMLTPNPAYVSAIAMLAPVWASLLYKLIGKKEETNIWMGLVFVGSMVMVVFLAAFIH